MPTSKAVIQNCSVTTSTITVTFSESVDSSTIGPGNITVYDPPAFRSFTALDPATWSVSPLTGPTLTATLTSSSTQPVFSPGDFVLVNISGISDPTGNALLAAQFSSQVPTAGLSVLDCSITTNSITITFSDPVDSSTLDLSDFTIYDPPEILTRTSLDQDSHGWALPSPPSIGRSVTLTSSSNPTAPFVEGDIVLVSVSGITDTSGNPLPPTDLSAQVPFPGGEGKIVRDVEDAISYPILTEDVGYRTSPVGLPTGGGGGMGGGGGRSSLGQVGLQAVTDVLGWKANNTDPKGFIGALTQAFTLNDVDGHVQATWVPRTHAVQTDLGGGISGAQASLYMRAKDALDRSLTLLSGLYPLDPDADPEYVKALREMARSQMTEIVKEFGAVGLPSILRIDTYFNILLGQSPASPGPTGVVFDPDQIEGTLGQIRETYGIRFANNRFNNSVADEEDITNFRVISDYMTSLMQSWIANRNFFVLAPDQLAFFGTQLVLISRQFSVIAETVNEVRFALDSVFIGPSERQTLLLNFADPALSPMFLEDVLAEVDQFVADEGPRLLRDGGRISVTNNILPVVKSLQNMIEQAHSPTNINQLPDGFRTARVRNSLNDLNDQLQALINLTGQVEQQVPPSLEDLVLEGVKVSGPDGSGDYTVSLLGDNFTVGWDSITVSSTTPVSLAREDITFYSAQRIDLKVHARSLGLEAGHHHITVKNPNGRPMALLNAFTYDPKTGTVTEGANPKAQRVSSAPHKSQGVTQKARVQQRSQGRRFPVTITAKPPAATARPAGSAPRPTPGPAIPDPIRDLSERQAELMKTVDQQSKTITEIDEKLENIFGRLKHNTAGQQKGFEEKLAQNNKRLEKLEEMLRQFMQRPGK